MFETTAAFFGPLLAWLFPASGRHRMPGGRWRQRRRRWALRLALLGFDVGPRRIHGVRVVTR